MGLFLCLVVTYFSIINKCYTRRMTYSVERIALLSLTLFLLVIFGLEAVYSPKNPTLVTPNSVAISTSTAPAPESELEGLEAMVREEIASSTKEESVPLQKIAESSPKTKPVEKQKVEETVAPISPAELSKTITETLSPPLPAEIFPASFSSINEDVRASLVNILCVTKSGGPLMPISGSGIVIDARGIILTNAHIAQYLLLKDYIVKDYVECIIRTGSPAYPLYTTELLYVSEAWIRENAVQIDSENPVGTGEHDYALLRITGTVSDDPIGVIPHTPIDTKELAVDVGSEALVAGYPAGFVGGITIQKSLYPASSVTSVREVFTFATSTVDLISVGGSIVAQKGSSGGAVVGRDGRLKGLVVTSTQAASTNDRDLRAITLSHINRDIKMSTGYSLGEFLSRNLSTESHRFITTVAPTLTRLLENALKD